MSEKKKQTKKPDASPESGPRLRTYNSVDYTVHSDGAGYCWMIGAETGSECATVDEAELSAEAHIRDKMV